MEINITSNLKMESEIPFIAVENFQFSWIPNRHAGLILSGYADSTQRFDVTETYDSKIKIWRDREKENQILFWGYLVKTEVENVGKVTKIKLTAKSGSYMLDQQVESRSFQNVEKTYAEVIRQAAECAGGRTICEAGADCRIGKPIIQYEETAWEFSKRLASHLGTCVIADLETGGEYFWFGMRKGSLIPAFSEEEYELSICRRAYDSETEVSYDVESRDFYKIGDRTRFCNQEMIICKVFAFFENGELRFKYSLKQNESLQTYYQNKFLGLGLTGTVIDTRQEQVKIALDIDNGDSTGDYFYDWYPDSGNALYAVPEKGTRILLYFGSQDEREGFALHSFLEPTDNDYKSRYLDTKEGNLMHLTEEDISFTNNRGHNVMLEDDYVLFRSTEKMNISALGHVKLSASYITINTPDELNICQG